MYYREGTAMVRRGCGRGVEKGRDSSRWLLLPLFPPSLCSILVLATVPPPVFFAGPGLE